MLIIAYNKISDVGAGKGRQKGNGRASQTLPLRKNPLRLLKSHGDEGRAPLFVPGEGGKDAGSEVHAGQPVQGKGEVAPRDSDIGRGSEKFEVVSNAEGEDGDEGRHLCQGVQRNRRRTGFRN